MKLKYLICILMFPIFLSAEEAVFKLIDITPLAEVSTPSDQSWQPNFLQKKEEDFHSLGNQSIDFQYSNQKRWIKFDLSNQPSLPEKFLIYFDSGLSGEMKLFELDENSTYAVKQITGSTLAWFERSYQNEYPVFQFEKASVQRGPFYIQFYGPHHFNAHAYLVTQKEFEARQDQQQMMLAIYFGIVLALFFYNLFLGLASRAAIYFWYIFATSAVACASLCLNGTFDRLIPLAMTSISNYQFLFSAVAFGASIQLARKLMNTDLDLDNRDRIMRILIYIALLQFTVYLFFGKYFGAYLGYLIDLTIVFGVIMMLTTAFQKALQGHAFAKFYLLSWSFVCLGAMVYLCAQFNIIQKSVITQFALLIGNALEMLLISFALAYRINLLTQAKNDAEKRAAAKDKYQRLVRTLAHDVTNSLSIIHATATQLQNAKILRATSNIQKLLTRVKNSESFQDGKEDWHLEEVLIKEILYESEFVFSEKFEHKKIQFIHDEVPEDLKVIAEPITLLNEVLNNALSNAIKFSNPGQKIELKCLLDKPGYVILEIIDRGIGIPKSMLDKFFLTTEMQSRTGTKGEQGTGYGMPLMVQYMRAYGGSVRIRSEEGKGTRVILQFKKA